MTRNFHVTAEMTEKATYTRGKLAGKLVLGIPLLAFTSWTALSMYQRIQQIYAHPDLNGDGKFSILDVSSAAASILLEVGNRYQSLLAGTKIGAFLEMRSDDPNIFWSVALAVFTYFFVFTGVVLLFDQEDHHDGS